MSYEALREKFKEWKSELEAKWGDLTDEDWKEVEGSKDKLIAKIQQKYGLSRKDARREVDDFCIEQVIRTESQQQVA